MKMALSQCYRVRAFPLHVRGHGLQLPLPGLVLRKCSTERSTPVIGRSQPHTGYASVHLRLVLFGQRRLVSLKRMALEGAILPQEPSFHRQCGAHRVQALMMLPLIVAAIARTKPAETTLP